MFNTKEKRIVRAEDKATYKVTAFIKKNWFTIACMTAMFSVMGCVAFAGGADEVWDTITGQITKWVTRLGGMVAFIGGIMFALGWKRDDADQKSQGISTVVAGAMVIAITQVVGTIVN